MATSAADMVCPYQTEAKLEAKIAARVRGIRTRKLKYKPK
jgi:hypothetical protein